jgi:4-diphosphocytidyl-2-C-methyl-D-erythritol kinase
MSGSGATCFGLFSDAASARAAAAHLTGAHPGWWIAPVTLGAAPAP